MVSLLGNFSPQLQCSDSLQYWLCFYLALFFKHTFVQPPTPHTLHIPPSPPTHTLDHNWEAKRHFEGLWLADDQCSVTSSNLALQKYLTKSHLKISCFFPIYKQHSHKPYIFQCFPLRVLFDCSSLSVFWPGLLWGPFYSFPGSPFPGPGSVFELQSSHHPAM